MSQQIAERFVNLLNESVNVLSIDSDGECVLSIEASFQGDEQEFSSFITEMMSIVNGLLPKGKTIWVSEMEGFSIRDEETR